MTLLEVTNYTWIVTFVGYGSVFIALILMVGIFTIIPKFFRFNLKGVFCRKDSCAEEKMMDDEISITGDEIAAISMALNLYYNDIHDDESNIITIKQIQRRYSPWSSKLFNMNNAVVMKGR